jgi:hypothetical protein
MFLYVLITFFDSNCLMRDIRRIRVLGQEIPDLSKAIVCILH